MTQQPQPPTTPAEAYERFFVPALAAPWAKELLRRAAPQPGERVLDVACGTGIVARLAAARVGPAGTVIGVDPNPGMLAVARSAAAAEGVTVDWREGRGEALPVDDAAVDLACCQQGLQFFADRGAGLREMRRSLAPGGRVAVNVGQAIDRHPLHAAVDEIIARHTGAPLFERTIFSLGNETDLRRLLQEAGFRDVTIEPFALTARFPNPMGFVRMQVQGAAAFAPSLAGMEPAARETTVAAVLTEAETAIQPFLEEGVLEVLAHSHVAQAHV